MEFRRLVVRSFPAVVARRSISTTARAMQRAAGSSLACSRRAPGITVPKGAPPPPIPDPLVNSRSQPSHTGSKRNLPARADEHPNRQPLSPLRSRRAPYRARCGRSPRRWVGCCGCGYAGRRASAAATRGPGGGQPRGTSSSPRGLGGRRGVRGCRRGGLPGAQQGPPRVPRAP
jgi:hypothetical protein